MPYDETFLPFAGRKLKETAKLEEGTRAFVDPKNFTNRSNKSTTSLKVGEEKDQGLGAPLVCDKCGAQFDSKSEKDAHLKSEHDINVQEEKFPFGPG